MEFDLRLHQKLISVLVSFYDDKELSSEADVINCNSFSKKDTILVGLLIEYI